MKKIFLYLCLLGLFSCAGYNPIFSAKNINYYIDDIINTSNDDITKKISVNLNNKKFSKSEKKKYILKITSEKVDKVTSKDSRGDDLTFMVNINVKVDVFYKSLDVAIHTFEINKNFNYNNQKNKFNLSQYKKTIVDNLINKISQDIIIKLQLI